jgi:hypothetical protein
VENFAKKYFLFSDDKTVNRGSESMITEGVHYTKMIICYSGGVAPEDPGSNPARI